MLTIPKEKLPIHIACIMDGNGRGLGEQPSSAAAGRPPGGSGYGGALCGLLHDP